MGPWFQSPDRRRKMSLGLLSVYGPTESSDSHGHENYLMGSDGPGAGRDAHCLSPGCPSPRLTVFMQAPHTQACRRGPGDSPPRTSPQRPGRSGRCLGFRESVPSSVVCLVSSAHCRRLSFVPWCVCSPCPRLPVPVGRVPDGVPGICGAAGL